MDDVAILRRVEHTIQQCRDFNMESDARTVAEIMNRRGPRGREVRAAFG
jgi:hypothetical protein